MKYSIFQLPIEHDNVFMGHNFAMNHGGINFQEYKTVYTGEIEGDTVDDILDKIYTRHNINHPADYRARSLSVSDLVALEDTGTYFCDSIGWKQLN